MTESESDFDFETIAGLEAQKFRPAVNSKFSVELPNSDSVEFELIEVKELRAYEGAPRQDPFSLLFRAPRDSAVSQGTYNVCHDELGRLPLFLVPVLPDQDATYFESVFN